LVVPRFSASIAVLANALASIEPALALQLAAIVESRAIAPFGGLDSPTFENLDDATRRLGPQALDVARARAALMSYSEAINYLFDGIDQLLEETSCASS
jgi:hypothetical protein